MNGHKLNTTIPIRFRSVIWIAQAVVLFFVLLAPASQAPGHVLQGPHVLDLMVHALGKAKTLQVEQLVTVEDPASSDQSSNYFETLSYGFPDRFRAEITSGVQARIALSVRGEQLLIEDGKWQTGQPNRFDRYKDILLLHSRTLLQKVLLQNGVDVGITSLGRFEDRIVYVIGARYPDESTPQVWVDKDLFVPLRWIHYETGDPSAAVEFIYRKWRKTGDIWYPAQIEIVFQQRLVRSINLEKIRVDGDLPPDTWDMERLRSLYQPATSAADPPESESGANEVQEALESFQKKFE